MPSILNKISIFACLLLLVLVGSVSSFETPSHAAESRQTARLAARSAQSSTASLNSQTSDNGEVNVIVTTLDRGILSTRVVATIANPTSTGEADAAPVPTQPTAAPGDIVLSQIYGSGGLAGSSYQNNFLEIFNRTSSPINISGWKFYIATATGTFNQSISFVSSRGIGIGAHRYLLIKFGPDSTNGAPLPTPDLVAIFHIDPPPGVPPIPDLNLFPSGKVFITEPGSNLLGTSCPLPNPLIIDFVGYGSTANCFEGTGPTATINNTTAAVRKNGGFIDTDSNVNDFAVRPPSPRNSSNRPIDDAEFFVRQHYSDFLIREADAAGLAFWIDQITSCGTDQTCTAIKRINVSGAFFQAIEFQETGFLAYRTYKVSYGNMTGAPVPLTRAEFSADMLMISHDVVVNAPGWEQQLENNKRAFFLDFVSRLRFGNAYPTTLSPDAFVDALFLHGSVTPSGAERTAAINEFGGAVDTSDVAARARALRLVAENGKLITQEKNGAFVLMQYFGYLRRNPNDPPEPGLNFDGYNFWLNKLNQFNGNFVEAEMVKAFIVSTEYRQRFGPASQ